MTVIRSLPSFLVLHTVGRITLYIFAACTFQSSFSQHCQFPLIAGLSLGSVFMPCDRAEGPIQTFLFKCNWRNLGEAVSLGFFLPCGFLPLQLHLRGKVPPWSPKGGCRLLIIKWMNEALRHWAVLTALKLEHALWEAKAKEMVTSHWSEVPVFFRQSSLFLCQAALQ